MFYMKGGSFALGGNTNVNLFGLRRGETSSKLPITTDPTRLYDFGGMLVYMAANNANEVNITGHLIIAFRGNGVWPVRDV